MYRIIYIYIDGVPSNLRARRLFSTVADRRTVYFHGGEINTNENNIIICLRAEIYYSHVIIIIIIIIITRMRDRISLCVCVCTEHIGGAHFHALRFYNNYFVDFSFHSHT